MIGDNNNPIIAFKELTNMPTGFYKIEEKKHELTSCLQAAT